MNDITENIRKVGASNGVRIGALKREQVRINSRGDIIDPETKEVIKRNEEKE